MLSYGVKRNMEYKPCYTLLKINNMKKILEIKNKGENQYFIQSNVEARHRVELTMLDQKDNCFIDNINFACIVAKDNCLKIEVFSDYELDDEVITFKCV
jgi:hypothetical protein